MCPIVFKHINKIKNVLKLKDENIIVNKSWNERQSDVNICIMY